MIEFLLNDRLAKTNAGPGTVVLDLVRREFGLKGTKSGCREGDCGACAVLLGSLDGDRVTYSAVPSCLLPVGELQGKHLVTIEGLNLPELTPIQQAMVEEGATQCGFCTPGFIVSITGFLLTSPMLSMEDAQAAIEGNICRCTGYLPIIRAVERALDSLGDRIAGGSDSVPAERVRHLVRARVLPQLFLEAPGLLGRIAREQPRATDPARGLSEDHGALDTIVAGGTDLFVQRREELRDAELSLLSRRPELSGVQMDGSTIRIGAATPVEVLRHTPLLRGALTEWDDALKLIASGLVRNRATIGGNIVNASPIADLAVMLLALDATLVLERDNEDERRIPLAAFYRGYKQLDLLEGETVTTIEFERPPRNARFHFEKVSRRGHLDIAGVNSAALIEAEDLTVRRASLAAGGVACIPLHLSRASSRLTGTRLSPDVVDEVAALAVSESSPITDVRGSAEYRKRLLRRLIVAHFVELFPSLELESLVT